MSDFPSCSSLPISAGDRSRAFFVSQQIAQKATQPAAPSSPFDSALHIAPGPIKEGTSLKSPKSSRGTASEEERDTFLFPDEDTSQQCDEESQLKSTSQLSSAPLTKGPPPAKSSWWRQSLTKKEQQEWHSIRADISSATAPEGKEGPASLDSRVPKPKRQRKGCCWTLVITALLLIIALLLGITLGRFVLPQRRVQGQVAPAPMDTLHIGPDGKITQLPAGAVIEGDNPALAAPPGGAASSTGKREPAYPSAGDTQHFFRALDDAGAGQLSPPPPAGTAEPTLIQPSDTTAASTPSATSVTQSQSSNQTPASTPGQTIGRRLLVRVPWQ